MEGKPLPMDLFRENNESMSGYFHAWVASKSLLMDVFCVKKKRPHTGGIKAKKAGCIGEQPIAGGAAGIVTQGQRPLT
ncbi:hypothetical protein [Geobacillus stearothermophilus]|uniref:hypothetical protein n=1 Tax=Geobacillus stearothermophilus TaxID=1422 RepID=UPI002E241C5A|nr:hypothetical protein [Geobacillus stearothermophilus]